MQKKNTNKLIYAATDLVNYLLCPSITNYGLINLDIPLEKAEDDEQAKLLQKKGFEHEETYLDQLRRGSFKVVDIAAASKTSHDALLKTKEAMHDGADIIFQAFLTNDNREGHIDFLKRVDRPSRLGGWSYEVVDTKLAKTPKPKFIIQLCFYSELLTGYQDLTPKKIHLVLGDMSEKSYQLQDFGAYYRTVRADFEQFLAKRDAPAIPDPCEHCDFCVWRLLCQEKWRQADHLSQVANISKVQMKKLTDAGITRMEELAVANPDMKIPKMAPATFNTLRGQAALQVKKHKTGKDIYDLLPLDREGVRGFYRLPEQDKGDLFFDMEGDPLEKDGLEYLFGLYFFESGKPKFKDFWAHNRQEEKRAFEEFIDFVTRHLKKYPKAHIYHYASYEETALKRLMCLHGTREAEVDNLLRTEKLVDLYKVVREGIRISEPSYSIKNIETFYMQKREGDVVNAAASIIFYENWKLTKDPALLQSIRDYNEEDCRSTYLLREWLLSIKPADIAIDNLPASHIEATAHTQDSIFEYETKLAETVAALTVPLPVDSASWTADDKLHQLTAHLLDFYRRADKPVWWAYFSRMEMTEEDLLENPECIGGMVINTDFPLYKEKRSWICTYHFPDQEHKIKEGQSCTRTDTGDTISQVVKIDDEANLLQLKVGDRMFPLPDKLSIGPGLPIRNVVLRDAVFRFAGSVITGEASYHALKNILRKQNPTIDGRTEGQPIVEQGKALLAESIRAVKSLSRSYLTIQGPPGSGKTYTAARIIAALIADGKRIGVTSNSHKAINNLLKETEEFAISQGIAFTGTKKCSTSSPDSYLNGRIIVDVEKNEDVHGQLVAATAWYFARPEADQAFDYLFVDEAGQISLAHLVAMGVAAENIVLLGDQMQLGQPTQGIHPGDSGKSVLEFLMEDYATIPDDMGIFLPDTYRMHPDVCRFISDAIYDGRLQPIKANSNRKLIISKDSLYAIRQTGLQFIEASHTGCSQVSEEEAATIATLTNTLLTQAYQDKNGINHSITLDNILIVAPYNMQVNLLKRTLPHGARVGTVDKFQGQQAEVVIISMTTSSREYMPRYIDFLFSKKRLNVAISRAKCLALLVANPELLKIQCNTIEQMGLVNTLCWAHEIGSAVRDNQSSNA